MLRARHTSTVPRLGARCPPLVPTVFIMTSRISLARAGSWSSGSFLRSEGECMVLSNLLMKRYSLQYAIVAEVMIVRGGGKCKRLSGIIRKSVDFAGDLFRRLPWW